MSEKQLLAVYEGILVDLYEGSSRTPNGGRIRELIDMGYVHAIPTDGPHGPVYDLTIAGRVRANALRGEEGSVAMSLCRKDNNELDAHDLREIRLRAIRGEVIDPKIVERMVEELTTLRLRVEYAEGAANNARSDQRAADALIAHLREVWR